MMSHLPRSQNTSEISLQPGFVPSGLPPDSTACTADRKAENPDILASNNGKRVKKIVPATGETTLFVYDAGGTLIAEYSTVLAEIPQVAYTTTDNLGSPRISTSADGAVIARHDYHPFGEEITAQRTELHVYVRNSPYKFVDTTGEDLILANSNARTTFRQVTTNGLTQAERNNIRVRADGRVVLRNPGAVNVQNASYAYQQIAGIVSNRNLTINVYSVAQGQTAQGASYQDVYNTAGFTSGGQGDAVRNVVIPVGGGVQVTGNPPGSGHMVPTTEDSIFAHEVFGHANGNEAITAENNYRRSCDPALGERSGEDHQSNVEVTVPAEIITTTPAQNQTTIMPRPIPTPPPPPRRSRTSWKID